MTTSETDSTVDSGGSGHGEMTQAQMVDNLVARRSEVRKTMGGRGQIARLHDAGRLTVRERIGLLCDQGSFDEMGTFVVSERPQDHAATPGDGVIGGHGTVDGRVVTVVGDDVTVKAGSTGAMGKRKRKRLVAQALRTGNPLVFFGESAGARIPDYLGAQGATEMELDLELARRGRRVPLVSVITGRSYGNSSFNAAHSDLVVQVAGSALAITSPRLIETATGEHVTAEELGGVDVHQRITGQVDVAVADDVSAIGAVKAFLGLLPQNSSQAPQRLDPADPIVPDTTLAELVPARLQRAYDMRTVVSRVVDDGSFFELSPMFGRGLLTGLARIGGHSVAILASQPKIQAGALDPDACDKATRLLCLSEAYNIPMLILQDVPGFMVGQAVEHKRLLSKVVMFQQALAVSTVPKITVVLRKAFGLAFYALGGSQAMADRVYAWPGATFGFMDQRSGAQVVAGNDLNGLDPTARRAVLSETADQYATSYDAFTPAQRMRVDEIIDPADTRRIVARDLDRLSAGGIDPDRARPLLSWPTRW